MGMKKTPASELICLLTRFGLSETESARATSLARKLKASEWEELAAYTRDNTVHPMVLTAVRALGVEDSVPGALILEWSDFADKVRSKNAARLVHVTRFLNELRAAGIPFLLLKGICLAEILYRDFAYKKMNDVDLLLKPEDIGSAYRILESLDYFPIGERFSGDATAQLKYTHAAVPYVSRDFGCVVGMLSGIKSPLAGYQIDYAAMWNRAVEFDFHGTPARRFNDQDMLIHLLIHYGFFKTQLKDLADIYNLIRGSEQTWDWNSVGAQIQEIGMEDHAYHALALANAVCPLPELRKLLAALKQKVSHRTAQNVEKRLDSLPLLLKCSSDHIQTVEKEMTYFNLTQKPSEKLKFFARTWRNVLFPPQAEVLRMAVLDADSSLMKKVMAQVVAPQAILSEIAEEMTPKLLAIVAAKTVIDLASTLAKSMVEKNPKGLLEFAKANGIQAEEFNRLVASIS